MINLLKKHIAQVCKCKVFHNFLCSPLEGEPKSLISKGGKISQCCGLLRHFVEKISHFGINVPHNDREICSLAPSDSAEQNNSVNCFVRGGLGRGGKCHLETLTRICNVHSSSRTNSALSKCIQTHTLRHSSVVRFVSQRERAKNEKNLLPYSLNTLFPLKKKAAFTLTEVLLAVLIVGIIAAMVLPAIVTKYQNKALDSSYLRQVHSLQDSIDSLAAVENQTSNSGTSLSSNVETYMKKYLRVSKYCGATGGDCFAKKYYQYTGNEKKDYTPSYSGGCAILKNGASVCINPEGNTTHILLDVNGPKGPNVLGRDLRTYDHTFKSIEGFDNTKANVIAINQTPIKENGTGEDPDPTPTPTPDPTPTPTPTTCSASDTSLACCKERGITKGQSDPCCKYSYFDSNSTCHPTQMLTVEFNSYIAGYNTPQISVTCSSSASSTTVDLSQVKGNVTAVWSSSNMGNYSKTYSFWGCSSNRKVLNTQDSIPEAATGFSSATIQYKGYNITSSNTCSKSMPRCVVYSQWRE